MDGNLTGAVPQRTMQSTGISVRNAFSKDPGTGTGGFSDIYAGMERILRAWIFLKTGSNRHAD